MPRHYGVEATVSGDEGRFLGRAEEEAAFVVIAEERGVGSVIHLPTRVEVHGREGRGPGHLNPCPPA